jgi:hypothetical protein
MVLINRRWVWLTRGVLEGHAIHGQYCLPCPTPCIFHRRICGTGHKLDYLQAYYGTHKLKWGRSIWILHSHRQITIRK